ncbi:sigma-54-dependent Fis family transcriptional regulator [Geovibrio thiophilus]|uniref:Sigma-54-dependent Fis family transcriptional regulator n=1 Tax=Geovibrio thiophilus TaxID=139438 RepID=A0A3R5UXY2_9BACT|nr:sigma-54 dependent transcriptional regulator [Geovibrio thiophilus]QAR32493.1 sigma-54-dependent Fis family transcriptional regulator [Geovibrio thiophilus]
MSDKNESRKVLIVDDDDNMREALKETVRRMGLSVETAENGREGFEKASSRPYDLIVSDMRMPEIDGLAMFNMMRSSGIETPVCFITAFGTVSNAVAALKLGASDYILKPFPPEVIEELIRRTFEIESLNKGGKRKKNKAVFRSAFMARLFALAKDVAGSEATVLITGESGTGKEVLARYIHDNSSRADGPFVAVNCAAIPENLIESELFGFEKGAFTGAINRKAGKFELADGGTILLDEIGEVPIHLQAKLLRVLQEREVERLGSIRPEKINVRILATTNRDLKKEVASGNFREDLFYRLNVIAIELPPLRERREDVRELAEFFMLKYAEINRKGSCSLGEKALQALIDYDWPGNVRELEHTVERAVVLCRDKVISERDLFLHGITIKQFLLESDFQKELPAQQATVCTETASGEEVCRTVPSVTTVGVTIAEMERELILKTLEEVGGNRTKAADLLGITVRTLRNKLNEYRESGHYSD